jgi:DNA replication protein DnaC
MSSVCFSDEKKDTKDANDANDANDENDSCCNSQMKTNKKRKNDHKISPIVWESQKTKIPPPPPRPFEDMPDETIVLSNGTNLIRRSNLCTRTNDHYEYKITKINDFLALADYYNHEFDHKKTSNINFPVISRISPHLYELNSLIGMEQVKDQVTSLVLFFIQSLDDVNHEMLHSVIYGNPGVGKTRLIYILSNIFATLGITEETKVIFVKRADLIGQYLGQTAVKTKKVLEDARGGVLVIDEAYSLGDTEQRDSYSRECIDTINQYLSECRRDLICIIAGYKDDLEGRFFKTNAGLKRRFAFKYIIPDYNSQQLCEIFIQNVKRFGWKIKDETVLNAFFEENHEYFQNNGGDMETLFGKIKFEHARRVFSGFFHERKIITMEDMEAGMLKFLENTPTKKEDRPPCMMYT